ncbi:hypothetical protein DENSPDRAFT_834264 [Dentipellis sp. KUC8613]|nr:hypothetical protein DENSPDRAFT_834264 [Dentipellis sp. KUC8613]
MRHLSADIEAILTNSLRPTITTLISRADERLITTINNTPHTDVPHVPPIPLRPFDLGLNSSQRPASPALSTNSLPALESISDSESESHYSGFIDDDDDDDDSSNVPERRLNRSAELEVLIARLWSAVSGVARAQGDARSVEPQEPNPEPYEAPEPPSPQFVPLPQLPDDRQDDNVSTPTVVHPEEPEGLLPDAGSFSAGEDHPPDETGLPPPVTIPSDMPTDSVSIGDASDPASTDLPSAPSSVVPPTTQETENPQPPNPDAEPPFMTDGRGRVVWSRVGSKTGGVHGRGRGRPGDTEDTGSG